MKLFSLKKLHLAIAIVCALVIAVFLYNFLHVLDMRTGIRVPTGYDVIEHVDLHTSLTLYKATGRNLSSHITKMHTDKIQTWELDVNYDNIEDYILINDYKLKMDYLPNWFLEETIIQMVEELGSERHSKSAKIPFFVKPDREYLGSSWVNFRRNVRQESLYVPSDNKDNTALTTLLYDLATLPVVAVKENTDADCLSFNVQFEDGGLALMRPKTMAACSQDSFSANIAAFQLDWALGFSRLPPTVGRYVNIMSEMASLLPGAFRNTIYTREDGRVCFYGTCAGCSREATSCCGTPEHLEVSLTLILPNNTMDVVINKVEYKVAELQQIPNPWMKTTESGGPKPGWVSEEFVCSRVKIQHEMGNTLPLEILDAMYFDMLIDNYERYNYVIFGQTPTQTVPLLYGQGSAFKSSCKDRALDDFLYRRGGCCLMKKSTFTKLLKLFMAPEGLSLSNYIFFSMSRELTGPSVSKDQGIALDRRLNKTIAFIVDCLKTHEFEDVVVKDIF